MPFSPSVPAPKKDGRGKSATGRKITVNVSEWTEDQKRGYDRYENYLNLTQSVISMVDLLYIINPRHVVDLEDILFLEVSRIFC